MAIKAAKTKFIVFSTRGKRADPEDCRAGLYNCNENGKPEIEQVKLKSQRPNKMQQKQNSSS
jgi:hypothetical protein